LRESNAPASAKCPEFLANTPLQAKLRLLGAAAGFESDLPSGFGAAARRLAGSTGATAGEPDCGVCFIC
jgi:hypothetical protein